MINRDDAKFHPKFPSTARESIARTLDLLSFLHVIVYGKVARHARYEIAKERERKSGVLAPILELHSFALLPRYTLHKMSASRANGERGFTTS